MTNTYTISLVGDPRGITATGVITSATWLMSATDGVHTVSLPPEVLPLEPLAPGDPAFIPFAKVTREIVLGWVRGALNLRAICGQLDEALAEKAAAVPVPMVLPGIAAPLAVEPPPPPVVEQAPAPDQPAVT